MKRKKTKAHDVFTIHVRVDITFFFMTACSWNFLNFLSQAQHIQSLFCAHLHYFFIPLIVYLLLHGFPFTRLIKTTFNVTLKDASV
jgi:hypothetical protein